VKRGRTSRKAPATGANDSLQRRIAGDVARWLEGLARHQPDLRALPHLGLTVLPDELVEAVSGMIWRATHARKSSVSAVIAAWLSEITRSGEFGTAASALGRRART
jgi:hypothetical protein